MILDDLKTFIGAAESFDIPDKLMACLLDNDKRIKLFDKVCENVDLTKDGLRDLFQNELAQRSNLKQDYTPDCICEIVSKIIPEDAEIAADICSGTGSLTVANGNRFNYDCEELSGMSLPMLILNLAVRGLNASVAQRDVLKRETHKAYKLTNDGKYSRIEVLEKYEPRKADVVISNPPYSMKYEIEEDERFDGYDMPPKTKADYAFVLDGLSRLSENGTAVYILPHGVLFRGAAEGKIRKKLIENNLLDAVIGLPEKLFLNTGIPVCIVVLKKKRQNNDVFIADASRLSDKSGKQNIMTAEHIEKVSEAYKSRRTVEKFSKCVEISEIIENDYNLNIPRYVDTSEKEPVPDLKTTIDEINDISCEIQKTENEIAEMMKQLVGTTDETEKYYRECAYMFLDYTREQKEKYDGLDGIGDIAEEVGKAETKEIKFLDAATIQRARKGEIYPQGSILLQVSATKGQTLILNENSEVDGKYAVIEPKNMDSEYFYLLMQNALPDFLRRYKTGLNINPEIFKYLKLTYHVDERIQKLAVRAAKALDDFTEYEEREITEFKKFKAWHLDMMFVNSDRERG